MQIFQKSKVHYSDKLEDMVTLFHSTKHIAHKNIQEEQKSKGKRQSCPCA
jgi:hypothetical protein